MKLTARSALFSGVIVILLVVSAIGAYALGRAEAPTETEAVSERVAATLDAFQTAREEAQLRTARTARKRGLETGRRAGLRLGADEGRVAGIQEVQRREAESIQVAEEAAADVAAAEAQEAEQLYLETHPWVTPYPSTSPPPDGSTGVAAGCYPVEGIPCD